ncbi:outer membrane beta-barrel protein [Oricola indica]|uniref:outer membrane beta-barrel protein n=1 Tax=Oricola indica TaxID=2872591 RepID=UPI003CCC0872
MPTVLFEKDCGRTFVPARFALLLATGGLGLCLCAPVFAQDLGGLRGVSGDDTAQGVAEPDAASGDPDIILPDDDAVFSPTRALPVSAVGPLQTGSVREEGNPYAALGKPLGSFVLRSTLDLGLNGKRESGSNTLSGEGSLQLDLESDWSRHALDISAFGRLQRGLSGDDTLEPEGTINATGRLDIGASTTLTGRLGYSYALDDPQSAAFIAATDPGLIPVVTGVNDPPTQTFSGSLALRQEVGRLYGEGELSVEHSMYGDAELSDATVIPQSDLDNTTIDGRLRAGIEASAVFSPFIEATYGVRRMRETPDSGGLDRNSVRYGLRLGTGIDLGEKLNGEISAGYLREDIADSALADIAGVSVDATFNWSPRRETDVTLDLSTSTETSGGTSESGALLYAANLGVTHRVRANLTAEAGFGAEYRDADGSADEVTLNADAALTFWFNRFAGLRTRVGHEETLSSDPAKRGRTTSAYVGLRLQR